MAAEGPAGATAADKPAARGQDLNVTAQQHQRDRSQSASTARAASPNGTVTSNGTHQQQNTRTESVISRATRRDRVSVGSRITRTIIVRPPYAARDELDFERRPRSNTVGTVTSAEATDRAGRTGRHAGVQPVLHQNPEPSSRSHISSFSEATGDGARASEQGQPDARTSTAGGGSASPLAGSDESDPATVVDGQTSAPSTSLPVRPAMTHRHSNDASRWLSFTLPMKYRKRLDDYMSRPHDELHEQQEGQIPVASTSASAGRQRDTHQDESDVDSDETTGDYHYRYFGRRKKRRGSQSRQASDDFEHQQGASGGRREVRKTSSRHSSANHRDAEGNEALGMASHPVSRRGSQQGGATGWSSPWLPNAGADPSEDGPGPVGFARFTDGQRGKTGQRASKAKKKVNTFQHWIVRSAFAPLFFRLLNLAFSASILAISIDIFMTSRRNNVGGIMGSSTTFAIVVGPLSILHIITNVYAEYFGSPIGVWKVRSKMFYTFTELIFICLWSGLLSLSFDDLFTSPAGCTAYTPNARYKQMEIGASTTDGSLASKLCRDQAGLVAVVFVGLILYVLVLIVSLFRIFAKISRYI